jgi:hypothetical protein
MVLATLLSGLAALFVGRLLTHWLPFRVPPVYIAPNCICTLQVAISRTHC